jgi:hypothetical protein
MRSSKAPTPRARAEQPLAGPARPPAALVVPLRVALTPAVLMLLLRMGPVAVQQARPLPLAAAAR